MHMYTDSHAYVAADTSDNHCYQLGFPASSCPYYMLVYMLLYTYSQALYVHV